MAVPILLRRDEGGWAVQLITSDSVTHHSNQVFGVGILLVSQMEITSLRSTSCPPLLLNPRSLLRRP